MLLLIPLPLLLIPSPDPLISNGEDCDTNVMELILMVLMSTVSSKVRIKISELRFNENDSKTGPIMSGL